MISSPVGVLVPVLAVGAGAGVGGAARANEELKTNVERTESGIAWRIFSLTAGTADAARSAGAAVLEHLSGAESPRRPRDPVRAGVFGLLRPLEIRRLDVHVVAETVAPVPARGIHLVVD